MRVTNNMLTNNLLWNVNKNLNSMNVYQKQLASGKRIHTPSDDPIGVTKVIKYKSDISQNEQYKSNTRDAIAWMELTENSLMDTKDILQRIRELNVQGTNGALSQEETSKIGIEIDQLRKELIKVGNASVAGKYIFSGFATDKPLFNPDGSYNVNFTSSKVANPDKVEYETGFSSKMTVNTHPLDVYGMVVESNYFTDNMPVASGEGTPATQTVVEGTFDLNADYTTAGSLNVTVGGTVFTVDSSTLDGTSTPLTKEQVVAALEEGVNGTTKLKDVVDVYYDVNDKLVIKNKNFGGGAPNAIVGPTHASYVKTTTAGTAGGGVTHTGGAVTGTLPGTGNASFVVNYNGVQKKITIDMTAAVDAPTLQGLMQTALNTEFSEFPANTVTATVGANIAISVNGVNDGTVPSLEVDYIASTKSKLISDIENLVSNLKNYDTAAIQNSLTDIDEHIDSAVTSIAEVGSKTNRLEFIDNRLDDDKLSLTKLLSEVYDVDAGEAIIMMKALENVYRASLSVGSKVIQPTLVDFIR